MSKHNILTTHAYAVADMDQSMMSVDDESDPRTDRSTGRVSAFSLFRAGQIAHRPPVTLDHAQTGALVTPPLMPPINHDRVWESLTEVSLNAESLARNIHPFSRLFLIESLEIGEFDGFKFVHGKDDLLDGEKRHSNGLEKPATRFFTDSATAFWS